MITKNKHKVVVVLLRQPRKDISEMRTDPFWEFGSFGLTGCHQRNLLHPKKAHELNGMRLAFVQGGDAGFKLVYLTPPVAARPLADRTEVTWSNATMPFTYESAPVVVSPDGTTDMPLLLDIFKSVNRNGWMGKFASKFRTRREVLPDRVAAQVTAVFDRASAASTKASRARIYTDALPFNPPKTDFNRRVTYDRLLAAASQGA
jgi:hypothetical protein